MSAISSCLSEADELMFSPVSVWDHTRVTAVVGSWVGPCLLHQLEYVRTSLLASARICHPSLPSTDCAPSQSWHWFLSLSKNPTESFHIRNHCVCVGVNLEIWVSLIIDRTRLKPRSI